MLGVLSGETVDNAGSRQEASMPSQNHDEFSVQHLQQVSQAVGDILDHGHQPAFLLSFNRPRVPRDYVTLMVLCMVWSGCTIGVVGAGISVGPDTLGRE